MTPAQQRQIRELTGLSQKDFGAFLGITEDAIYSQEAGRRKISKMQILLIEQLFKKPFDKVIK